MASLVGSRWLKLELVSGLVAAGVWHDWSIIIIGNNFQSTTFASVCTTGLLHSFTNIMRPLCGYDMAWFHLLHTGEAVLWLAAKEARTEHGQQVKSRRNDKSYFV